MGDSMAGRKVAVIGATGFIGSHLTEHLVRCGACVLAVARTTGRVANLKDVAGDCRFRTADIRHPESIRPVLAEFKPEMVFHMASDVDGDESFAHMTASIETNAIGTANVLEAAARAGSGVLIYADTCKVYGNGAVPYRQAQPEAPVCSYAIGKAAGWRLCLLAAAATGMGVRAVRSTSAYGPRQGRSLIAYVRECVRRGTPVKLMGGSQTRDPIHVDDLVRAFLAAAGEAGPWGCVVPVGGGCEISVADLCRWIVRLLGGGVEVVPDAFQPRTTEIWRTYCDNAEARQMLGWSPLVSLEEGLRWTLEGEADAGGLEPSLAGGSSL
jgi:UDP-glucose 4-epimerase